MTSGRPRGATLAITLAVLLAGCNDGRPTLYPVRGTVAFTNGEPVRNATIEFAPTAPGPSPRARVDAQGRFELSTYEPADGAPAGEYRVVVAQSLPPDTARTGAASRHEHLRAGAFQMVALKHAAPETTGIVETVQAEVERHFSITVEAR